VAQWFGGGSPSADFLFDPVKNVIERFPAHVENRAVFGNRFLRHPFRDTVILRGKACAAISAIVLA